MWTVDSLEYGTRKKLTIDHTKVGATLTDFPVLVKLTDARFDWSHANADGFDIRFTTSDGSTLCKYERERHDGADYAEYWVKIPSVSTSTDTDFYIYYRTTDTADGADPENVWDANFKGVYHLKDLTTSTVEDSTSNNNDGTKSSANNPIEIDGKIAKGQDFSSDQISTTLDLDSELADTAIITIALWFKLDVNNLDQYIFASNSAYIVGLRFNGTGNTFNVYGDGESRLAGSWTQDTNWHYAVIRFDKTNVKLFIDGTEVGTAAYNGDVGDNVFTIGNTGMDGKLDECRVSNVSRSAEWITASYHSEADTLLTYGAEEESAATLSISVYDSVTVSEDISVSFFVFEYTLNISDSVTVSENVVLFITSYFLNIYDSISVIEALVYDPDLVYVSEYIDIRVGSFAPTDLHDDITVSENINLYIPQLFISVFDSVTVSENVNLFITELFISVSDSVTVSENINLYIPQLFISVFDSVTVSENIDEFINQRVPSVFDSITVSENINLFITGYFCDIYDSVTVSENVNILITQQVLSVFDSVTVSEDVNFVGQAYEDFYESITVSEDIVLNIPVYIDVYDDVDVSEESQIQSTNGFFTDDITVSEYINLLIPILFISVYDSVTVTEEESEEGLLFISVYDNVICSDINITTYDEDDVEYDDPDVCYEGIPMVFIEIVSNPGIYDDVTVSEYVELFIPTMTLSVYDDVTVGEYILLDIPLPVDVYDDIGITEYIDISIKTDEDFYELITVSEDIQLQVSVSVDVYDSISVSEYVLLSVPLPVGVYNSVSVSENVDISVKTDEDFYELITVSEYIQLQVSVSIDVYDSVSVSEYVLLSIPLPVDVNDSVTVSENIEISVQTDEDFYELITVSEYITFDIRLPVDVHDDISVTDNIKPEIVSHIYPFENVFVYEYFLSIKNTFGYDIPSRRPMGEIDILIGMGDAPIYQRLGEIDVISDAGSGTSVEYIGSGEIDNNYIIGGGL